MSHLSQSLASLFGIILISIIPSFSFSQKDFDNYQTLLCKGKMPFDFKASIAEKVAKDMESSKISHPSKTDALNYWTEIHTELEEVLYSGKVIYGDDISLYIQSVAANLLKEDQELFRKLRFYTIKSNEVNAFSTAPGIIFVTTGLVSQLSSEAQLAFILSHEIAHFEKDHVYREYTLSQKTGTKKKRDQIIKLTQFSKELEFEADELAMKRYHRLGYSQQEMIGTFDILMYSYLPFDEIPFPNNYFNTEQLFIPVNRIDKEIKEITAREDYDDKYHSHPNIKKRKDSILSLVSSYSNWGETRFLSDETRFREMVKICRFEDVRINLVQGNVFNALYSIFLLERLYPENLFLQHMEAVSWLSILQTENIIHKRFKSPKIEGESSKLYQFLKQSKKVELSTIGLRILYDLKAKHPSDEFLVTAYDNYIRELSTKDYFTLSKFQTLNYHQAAEASIVKANEPKTTPKDTLQNLSGDKYSRIKEKRAAPAVIAFDSTNYSFYSLSDIILDSVFQSDFKRYKAHSDSVDSAQKVFKSLSEKEQNKVKEEEMKLLDSKKSDKREILVMDPQSLIFSEKSVPDWEKDKAQKEFLFTIRTLCAKNGFKPLMMKGDSVAKLGTDALNEYATYNSYLEQLMYTNRGKNCPSVDFKFLKETNKKRGISCILSTQIYYFKSRQSMNIQNLFIDLNNGNVLLSDIQRSNLLNPAYYTPFLSDFLLAVRQL